MINTYLYGAHVNANGIRQHYLRYAPSNSNNHPVVIVVPGITSPAITWGFVAERLGQKYDTYVLDVRGRGLSETGDQLDYGIDACADDIAAFAAAMNFQEYAILGHSMGARFGIRSARRNPQGVRQLVLVDPPVSGPGRRPYPSQLPWYVYSIAACVQGADHEVMRGFCPTWTEQQLRLRAEWLHTCHAKAVIDSFNGFHEDDIHQDLPHLSVPIRLIGAGKGDVILDEDVTEIKRLQPNVEFVRVPAAGHMIPWDDLEGFFVALGNCLD
jgi:N-formylmaleamate deformylase